MKQDFFKQNSIEHIDYKDIDILKRFLTPQGRVMPRKRSGLTAKNQRALTLAIKRARFMGLLPYLVR